MTSASDPDTDLFSSALGALRQGELAAASALCEQMLKSRPSDPAVQQLAATIELARGDGATAARWAASSLVHRPDHVPTLIIAGRAARLTGDLATAEERFRLAGALDPARAEPFFLLCITLLEEGKPEATALLKRLLEHYPDDADGWAMLGDALREARQPEAALIAFTRATSTRPSAVLHLRRGSILQSLGRLDEALAAFAAAQDLAPDSVQAILKTALCQKLAGELEDACRSLGRAVRLDPSIAEAWFELGLIQQDRQDLRRAIDAYEGALRARPAFAESAVNLGICRQALGDLKGAKEAYRIAVKTRMDTFGRIAQALACSSVGEIWLDPEALRRSLAH